MSDLLQNIGALLELDAHNALIPHGIRGHARNLLVDCAAELTDLRAASTELISKNDEMERERDGLRDCLKAVETLIQPLRSENILAAVQRMVNEVEGAAEQFNAMRRTAEEMADRLSTAQAAEARLRGAGELTLMFHSGEPWDAERSSKWMSLLHTLIGTEIQRTRIFDYGATTKNLCDAVRAALASPPTAALPDGEALLDWLEKNGADVDFDEGTFVVYTHDASLGSGASKGGFKSLRAAIRAAITGATP